MSARIADSSRVLSTGQRSVTRVPMPELHLTVADVKTPETLHRFLAQFIAAHKEVSRAHRSAGRLRAAVYDAVSFTAGQNLPALHHKLGSVVYYDIVRWVGATSATACQYSEVTNDGDRLILHAITTGVASLEVWAP
jgi:hypothetical protein